MIVYDKLWQTLKERGISQYRLINEFHVSTGQLDRLRKNANVNTYTLNQLCMILGCRLEDIAEYVESEDEKWKSALLREACVCFRRAAACGENF